MSVPDAVVDCLVGLDGEQWRILFGITDLADVRACVALRMGWPVATFIMNADRWGAGGALMKAQSPEAWNVLMAAGKLTADNSAALAACRDGAAKTKKEQRCSIVVPAPYNRWSQGRSSFTLPSRRLVTDRACV